MSPSLTPPSSDEQCWPEVVPLPHVVWHRHARDAECCNVGCHVEAEAPDDDDD